MILSANRFPLRRTMRYIAAAGTLLGQHAERLRRRAERARSVEYVSEAVALHLDRQRLSLPGRDEDIEITRIGRHPFDRAALAPEVAANDTHAGAVVVDDLGDHASRNVLVARRGHFQRRGQIRP